MPLVIYLDECVDHSIIPHLERHGYRVATAQEEGTDANDDEAQLRYAAERGWMILTTNRRHFHSLHRGFQGRGESHSGIITIPQDDQQPARFALRCVMTVAWIATTFDARDNRLFRWTDLQQALQQDFVLSGFSAAEIAYAAGGERGS